MKTFLSFVLVFFICALSFSQQYFEIRKLDSSANIVNDSFLIMNAPPSQGYYYIHEIPFIFKNITNDTAEVRMTRTEVDVHPGTMSTTQFYAGPLFLEAGVDTVYTSPFSIELGPGESNPAFLFQFKNMGEDGCSLYKFELWNVLNPTERESFHIKVYHNTAQVDCSTLNTEESSFKNELTIYPNPVKDILNIDNLNPSNPDRIEICDLLGKVLIKKNLKNSENKSKIDLSMLSEGMYLLKLVKENRVIRVDRIKKI